MHWVLGHDMCMDILPLDHSFGLGKSGATAALAKRFVVNAAIAVCKVMCDAMVKLTGSHVTLAHNDGTVSQGHHDLFGR